eukprot:1032405-Pyramimonas_sp.AAC.1
MGVCPCGYSTPWDKANKCLWVYRSIHVFLGVPAYPLSNLRAFGCTGPSVPAEKINRTHGDTGCGYLRPVTLVGLWGPPLVTGLRPV